MPRILCIFFVCHAFIWIVLPLVFRVGVPMDALETLVWGTSWEWGTNKHPFLSAWVADVFFTVLPNPAVALYVLSQVCVITAFVFIYKLARCLTDEKRAILSTMFLEGTIYYTVCSIEYNVNVLSLPLVAAGTYFFYKALFFNRLKFWILTGVFAGLMVMTKYTNGFFLLGWASYLILTKKGRTYFKTSGLWVAGIISFLIVIPHAFWLVRHDFYVFNYLFSRAATAETSFWGRHLIEPIRFLTAQIAAAGITLLLIVLTVGVRSLMRRKRDVPMFLGCVGLLPLLYFAGVGVILGNTFRSMWGFPFLGYLPLILLMGSPVRIVQRHVRRGIRKTLWTMGILAMAFILGNIFHVSKKASFDGEMFAQRLRQIWIEQTGEEPVFVGGDIWYASNIAVWGEERLPVLIDMDPQTAPWIDMAAVHRKGVLVVASDPDVFETYRIRWPKLKEATPYPITFENKWGQRKNSVIYYGILRPEEIGGDK